MMTSPSQERAQGSTRERDSSSTASINNMNAGGGFGRGKGIIAPPESPQLFPRRHRYYHVDIIENSGYGSRFQNWDI